MQAHVGQRPAVELVDAQLAEMNLPAVGRVEPPDRIQQRGFAGAGRPGQADESAGLDGQVDVVQAGDDFITLPEGLAQLFAADRGHGFGRGQVVFNARTGSSLAARQAGKMLVRMPRMMTTAFASSVSYRVRLG